MRVDQAKRLKELEKKNAQLKKLVADQALDIAILREAASGNFSARRNVARPLAARQWSMFVRCWAGRRYQSAGPVGCWVRPARRSATIR